LAPSFPPFKKAEPNLPLIFFKIVIPTVCSLVPPFLKVEKGGKGGFYTKGGP